MPIRDNIRSLLAPVKQRFNQSRSGQRVPSGHEIFLEAGESSGTRNLFLPATYQDPSQPAEAFKLIGNNFNSDQATVDLLDEEINQMDSTDQDYIRQLRNLSKLCGSVGCLPSSYVLREELTLLGQYPHSYGGFSDVWKARYGEGWAAVKVLRLHVADQLAMKKAFCREVTYWKRLNHPHIVRFLGISSRFYLSIVSEWMANGDLLSYLELHPGAERLPLITQVAIAMEYMHSSQVVHGDIKGRNVLINGNGLACLSDFGLAVTVYRTQSLNAMRSGTGSSISPGTIRWSAPERLMPTEDPRHTMPTKASDVYSFGIMMWEVYTGQIPFPNLRHEWTVVPRIVNGLRPSRLPEISGRLWPLMEDCWKHDRKSRPSSAILSQKLQEELTHPQFHMSAQRQSQLTRFNAVHSADYQSLYADSQENGLGIPKGVSLIPASLEVANKFSGSYPPLRDAISGLLLAMESIETVEGVQRSLTHAVQRLVVMKTVHENRPVELDASEKTNLYFNTVVRAIRMVEKTIKAKSDRGVFNRISQYPKDITAASSALRMLGDVADYLAIDSAGPMHPMAQEVLDKLTFVDSAHFLSVKTGRQCTESTRVELLTELLAWGTAPSGVPMICFVNGPVGSGKSTIAHTVCSIFQGLDLLGGCFFCSRYDDDRRRFTRSIFSTLARSLANHDRDYASALVQILRENVEAGSFGAAEQLKSLIISPIRDAHLSRQAPVAVRVFVIDALDECADDDTTIYNLMCTLLAEVSHVPLKFLITSRPGSSINQAAEQAKSNHYVLYSLQDVMEDIARGDILTYLRSELNERALTCHISNGWPPLEQVKTLASRADTSFIYASTACKYIWSVKKASPKRLTGLTSLSAQRLHGINLLYDFVIGQVRRSQSNATWKVTRQCLQTIASLRQPLSLGDLADFINIDRRKLRIALEGLKPVLSIPSSDDPAVISVFHASFPEYLIDIQRTHSKSWLMESTAVHLDILRRCLAIMRAELHFNISNSHTSYASNIEQPTRPSISGALRYSCLHWIDHLECCDGLLTPDMSVLRELLYERFLYWLEVLSVTSSVPAAPSIVTRLLSWMEQHDKVRRDAEASVVNNHRVSGSQLPNRNLRQFAVHAKGFVRDFSAPIERSCPHIYLSALAASNKKRSEVWLRLSNNFKGVPRIITFQPQETRLLLVMHGHEDWVHSVAFSPDGSRFASSSEDETIRLWDVATGAAIGTPLRGHEHSVRSVAFSRDGTRIASGSWDRTIRLWDGATGAAIGKPLRGHKWSVRSVAFSPDGTRLVSGSADKTVRLWDVATGAAIGKPIRGHLNSVNAVAFSPDGTYIASGSSDQTICLWEVETRAAIGSPIRGHEKAISSVVFSPDGTRIVSGSEDHTIRVWDAATGAAVGEPLRGHDRAIWSLAVSPDGTRIASGSDDLTILLWDVVKGTTIGTPLRGHGSRVASIAFSPDGTRILSGSRDLTIRLWEAATGVANQEPLRGHEGEVRCVAFSPDGTRIASGSSDWTIRLWNVATGAGIGDPMRGHKNRISSVAFSSDGKRIVSGSWDCMIRLWDATTGAAIWNSSRDYKESPLLSVAFTPDEKHILSASDDGNVLWHASKGERVRSLCSHQSRISCVSFSPDGTHYVSGSDDRTIRLCHLATGEVIGKPLHGHTSNISSVAFSPDGKSIISGSWDQTICHWGIATGKVIEEPLRGHQDRITSIEFSSDGTRIVSGSWDRTIRVWDAATGAAIGGPLYGHENVIRCVAFSPDGTRIVSGSSDRTIRLWHAATPTVLAETLRGHKPVTVNEVAFSSDSAHCTCIDRLLIPGRDPRDSFTLDQEGWLRGSNNELFLWLPPEHRRGLWWPRTTAVVGTHSVMLDLSHFIHGEDWTRCFLANDDKSVEGSTEK